jgi:DNA modification methylase
MEAIKVKKNKLFYGDNLNNLRKYIKDECIDLCYIDPPFNSNRNYNQIYLNQGKEDKAQAQAFVDTWEYDVTILRDIKDFLILNILKMWRIDF